MKAKLFTIIVTFSLSSIGLAIGGDSGVGYKKKESDKDSKKTAIV